MIGITDADTENGPQQNILCFGRSGEIYSETLSCTDIDPHTQIRSVKVTKLKSWTAGEKRDSEWGGGAQGCSW